MTEEDMEDFIEEVGELLSQWQTGVISAGDMAEKLFRLHNKLVEND